MDELKAPRILVGTIKAYNKNKAFGFIDGKGEADIYFNQRGERAYFDQERDWITELLYRANLPIPRVGDQIYYQMRTGEDGRRFTNCWALLTLPEFKTRFNIKDDVNLGNIYKPIAALQNVQRGKVKFFDEKKGFGFLTPKDPEERELRFDLDHGYRYYYTNFRKRFSTLKIDPEVYLPQAGDWIYYEPVEGVGFAKRWALFSHSEYKAIITEQTGIPRRPKTSSEVKVQINSDSIMRVVEKHTNHESEEVTEQVLWEGNDLDELRMIYPLASEGSKDSLTNFQCSAYSREMRFETRVGEEWKEIPDPRRKHFHEKPAE